MRSSETFLNGWDDGTRLPPLHGLNSSVCGQQYMIFPSYVGALRCFGTFDKEKCCYDKGQRRQEGVQNVFRRIPQEMCSRIVRQTFALLFYKEPGLFRPASRRSILLISLTLLLFAYVANFHCDLDSITRACVGAITQFWGRSARKIVAMQLPTARSFPFSTQLCMAKLLPRMMSVYVRKGRR